MLLKMPESFELAIGPAADYVTALTAMSFAALKSDITILENVERTDLLRGMEEFLASANVVCTWHDRAVTIDPTKKKPFRLHQPVTEYDLFKYMIALAATAEGSAIGLIDDLDDTIRMAVLALRRMGAELEVVGGKKPRLVVKRAVHRAVKYHLKRESAKITPQIVLAMAAMNGESELLDPLVGSRFDYVFRHFCSGFERSSIATELPEDELERRLRRKTPRASEFKSKVLVSGGLQGRSSTLYLRPDVEFAAYLAAAAAQGRFRLTLRDLSMEDISSSPLAQLKRMGVEFSPSGIGKDGGFSVANSIVKGRKVSHEQLSDYPDAIGAIALAAALAEGTSVIRSSPSNTRREKDKRGRLCEAFKSLGVKIAEIDDGFVVEGVRELEAGSIKTEGDPHCALLAVAASLGAARQIEVDDLSSARFRWGESFEQLLTLNAVAETISAN